MKTETWIPGSNNQLDTLFDQLREQQFNDKSHKLHKNYSREFYKFCLAFTIVFDDNGMPEMCSSISQRDCWPSNAYRILNRLWKVNDLRKQGAPGIMSESFGLTALSQIDWINNFTNNHLVFISRETENWERWVSRQFKEGYNLNFKMSKYKFLTCPNECEATCWQKIIYIGNDKYLKLWKKRALLK